MTTFDECHQIEQLESGEHSFAYAGQETPWHGLGHRVSNDLSPEQMLKAAHLDWNVYTEPCYANINGVETDIGRNALIRDRDNQILDIISDDWKPLQNIDAFEFFNDFVAAGEMNMETAGSLRGGRNVFALAKINEGFTLLDGKDEIEGYLLFSNPHKYGQAISVRCVMTRVVCSNTLAYAMNEKTKNKVSVNHCREFDADLVKETLGISKERLAKYKEQSEFLASKRFKNEDIVEYFKRVFPVTGEKKDISRNAKYAIEEGMHEQLGAELGEGSFWQLYNTVTWMHDWKIGRSQDTRLQSAWFGSGAANKQKALETALEMAG